MDRRDVSLLDDSAYYYYFGIDIARDITQDAEPRKHTHTRARSPSHLNDETRVSQYNHIETHRAREECAHEQDESQLSRL